MQEKNDRNENNKTNILYSVNDVPPWHLTIFLAIQQYIMMVDAAIAVPFLLAAFFCIADDNPAKEMIISTTMFVSGIQTLLQTILGIRLPIVQGTSAAFLLPTIAILKSAYPACSSYDFANMTEDATKEVWTTRMREIQGDIIIASFFQMFIGVTGLIGFLLRGFTPLVLAPTITLMGISLFDVAATLASKQWWLAILTMVVLILFSQYLSNISIPFPSITYSEKKIQVTKLQVFKLFPVLMAIFSMWILCVILTEIDVLAKDSPSRTDTNIDVFYMAPWFRIPYPFQFGFPSASLGGIIGMVAAVLASVVESISDYYACAKLSESPPPPVSAINRGILLEGFGCLLSGMFGTGNGTTSMSQNIAVIRVTKVGSRIVIQVGAIMLLLFGVFSKFGALFMTLPSPIMGGLFYVMFGMITAVGISNLEHVNMNSSRNIFVLGFSLFFGLSVPKWVVSHPEAIQTGVPAIDQIILILLGTSMFVGGLCGLILDNTIPGTPKDRGIEKTDFVAKEATCANSKSVYDLPFGMNCIRKRKWCSKTPTSPTFGQISQNDLITRL